MRIVDIYAGWRRHQSDSLISVPQIKFPDWLVSVTGGLLGGTKINVVAPPPICKYRLSTERKNHITRNNPSNISVFILYNYVYERNALHLLQVT